MHILRVFNTNVVLARDDAGREVVLTGRGLGFRAKPGQPVDLGKVVRTFVPDGGGDAEGFAAMLATITPELVQIVDRALAPVWAELGREPSSTTVLALADHLSFALKRVRRDMVGSYPLRAEVAHLYPRELAWSERVIDEVNAQSDVPLPREEAVPIALHLVNAAFSSDNLALTHRMTGVLSQVLDMVEASFGRPFDRDSVHVARFITHLRYFFVRMHAGQEYSEGAATVLSPLRTAYPDAYRCARRVGELLELRLGKPVTEDELAYLTLHTARLAAPDSHVRKDHPS